jgi:hypothetical protein
MFRLIKKIQSGLYSNNAQNLSKPETYKRIYNEMLVNISFNYTTKNFEISYLRNATCLHLKPKNENK